ncbi:MFS transporter [Streptomyces sp. BH055]|uniref:MFS transporter n=1 Tax=Streptomyces sp. BH055 TaxID=3401173 RepID=UPI003BB66AD0
MASTLDEERATASRAPKGVRSAVIAGSAMEWFDFYLYASMAALVFGKVFFPAGEPALATMAALGTFAVGFFARPVGGIVFGMMGDRLGRKKVLSLTFTLMGASSACIGLLPSYASIGVMAPVLLILLRLLQGLGAGAEFGGAIAVAYEHADAKSRGRQGSWPALGVNVGLLASSLTVAALTSMNDDFLYSVGWRIPFVLSFLLVGIGLWVRRNLPETPAFKEMTHQESARPTTRKKSPLIQLFRTDWRGLAVVMAITIGYNGVSYTFKTFSLSYLTDFQGVSAGVGALGISIASCCSLVTVPLAGRLSDAIGSKKVVVLSAAATAALAFPFFWLLDTRNNWLIWLGLTLATGVTVPALLSAQGAFLARQFPPAVRGTGLGTGREVGGAFSGGLAPLAAFAIVQASPSHATWGVSLLFLAGALFIGVGAVCDQSRRYSSDLN